MSSSKHNMEDHSHGTTFCFFPNIYRYRSLKCTLVYMNTGSVICTCAASLSTYCRFPQCFHLNKSGEPQMFSEKLTIVYLS